MGVHLDAWKCTGQQDAQCTQSLHLRIAPRVLHSSAIHVLCFAAMFVGFAERRTNVSERTAAPGDDAIIIAIEVSTERTSELIHTSTIYVVESKTATVESFSSHSLFYDALFGTRVVPGDPLQEVHLLRSGMRRYQKDVHLSIINDFLAEHEECFTLSISTRNDFGQEALCNADDDSSASSYFCEHTICIEDDDDGT